MPDQYVPRDCDIVLMGNRPFLVVKGSSTEEVARARFGHVISSAGVVLVSLTEHTGIYSVRPDMLTYIGRFEQ